MEQDNELEEGELSNDSDSYTPLERPSNYSNSQPNPRFSILPESESELEFVSSETDSDSDCVKKKVKRVKTKIKPIQQQQDKKKKYDIWSTRINEEVLTVTMNSCDVTAKDRSRDVESYTREDALDEEVYAALERTSNKRSRHDRHNPHFRPRQRPRKQINVKGSTKSVEDLIVTADNTPEEIARDIANKLAEEKEDLILRIINTVGVEKAFLIFKETKRIEEEGGLLIMNQTRRRTAGGVFLFLVRHDFDITPEQRNLIFDEEKFRAKQHAKKREKQKLQKLKAEIAASKTEILPDLLTRAELWAKENTKVHTETHERDVVNPPPTPETDGGHENSGDGMDNFNMETNYSKTKVEDDDNDFLDINCSNDMDLF